MPTNTSASVGGTPARKSAQCARKNTRERKMELNKIFNMDCLVGMKQIDTGTIDLIASDPPYQLTSTRVYRQEKEIDDIKGDGTLRANMQQKKLFEVV
jgi:DNA modification methylase